MCERKWNFSGLAAWDRWFPTHHSPVKCSRRATYLHILLDGNTWPFMMKIIDYIIFFCLKLQIKWYFIMLQLIFLNISHIMTKQGKKVNIYYFTRLCISTHPTSSTSTILHMEYIRESWCFWVCGKTQGPLEINVLYISCWHKKYKYLLSIENWSHDSSEERNLVPTY